jgi:hypothetical protein
LRQELAEVRSPKSSTAQLLQIEPAAAAADASCAPDNKENESAAPSSAQEQAPDAPGDQSAPPQDTDTKTASKRDREQRTVIEMNDPEGLFPKEKQVLADGTSYRSPIFSDGRYLYLLTKLSAPPKQEEEGAAKSATETEGEQCVDEVLERESVTPAQPPQATTSLEPQATTTGFSFGSPSPAAESAELTTTVATSPAAAVSEEPQRSAAADAAAEAEAAPPSTEPEEVEEAAPARPVVVDHRIYMGDIPRNYDEERVRELLVPFGDVRSLILPREDGTLATPPQACGSMYRRGGANYVPLLWLSTFRRSGWLCSGRVPEPRGCRQRVLGVARFPS